MKRNSNHLADAIAEFLAWSAQVDVDEQSAHIHQKWWANKATYRRRRSADATFREKDFPRQRDNIVDLFKERRRIKDEIERSGNYDIRGKVLKLALNSIYPTLSQSVGPEGRAAAVANPYYAAATTAYCHLEVALLDPHAIAFFATDGIEAAARLAGRIRLLADRLAALGSITR
jgi:hypothetical protein